MDQYLLDRFQAVFNRIEYRWGFTSAQVAEIPFLLMWAGMIVANTMRPEKMYWLLAFQFVMLLATIHYTRVQDMRIRTDRKNTVKIMSIIREYTIFRVLRLFTVSLVLANVITTATGIDTGWDLLVNFTSILNFIGIYFFWCLDDVDGSRRKRMEEEEAERYLEKATERA